MFSKRITNNYRRSYMTHINQETQPDYEQH